MSTEREIVYNILNLHNAGKLSDDFTPSYNQVAFMLRYCRAMFIRRDLDDNWASSAIYQQDLGELKLISVDKNECPTFLLGCNVLRTEKKIPKLIRLKTKDGFTFIGAVDKTTEFDRILPQRAKYIQFSKYTSGVARVYYLNDYIYVTGCDMAYINARGILEDPKDALKFLCSGEACFTHDSEYPLPADMIQPITELILSKEMNYMLKTAPDAENNSNAK